MLFRSITEVLTRWPRGHRSKRPPPRMREPKYVSAGNPAVTIILFGTSFLHKSGPQDSKIQKSQNALVESLVATSRVTETAETRFTLEQISPDS